MRKLIILLTISLSLNNNLFALDYDTSATDIMRSSLHANPLQPSSCELCLDDQQAEKARCDSLLSQNQGTPPKTLLKNSEEIKVFLDYKKYCSLANGEMSEETIELEGLPMGAVFPSFDCKDGKRALGNNNLEERILMYGNFLRRNVNDLSQEPLYKDKFTSFDQVENVYRYARDNYCVGYFENELIRKDFNKRGSMQDCENSPVKIGEITMSKRFAGGVGRSDYENTWADGDSRNQESDGQTWRIKRSGYKTVLAIQNILTKTSLSCAQKQSQIQALVNNIEVDLIEDHVLWNYLKNEDNFKKFLDNPSFRQIIAISMAGGEIDTKAFKVSQNLQTVGEGLKLRNSILSKSLSLLNSEPYKLSNTFDFANLSPEQQNQVSKELSNTVTEVVLDPAKRNQLNEDFRSGCDSKVSELFTDGGFCTVSGASPVRKVDGKIIITDPITGKEIEKPTESAVPGLYTWGGYDSGWDGRFHCYVDEKLSSKTSDEKKTLYRPHLNNLSCFKGRTTNLPRLSISHVKAGRGIGPNKPNSTPVGTFGGNGGGGAIDGSPEVLRSYLHAHFEYVIRGSGKNRQRIDPADLYCRGTCQ
ncbi:MAG: hypothetical protein COW01_03065 [Bdellovibrionales bacterium CG12_big_fil_rev_8_21_14_0_65_38_15]|nr:MAG: hypothetical protein COW79_12305 [Bdellovibrionales bacterium CG22_combo_CG10-13_8_21_14_all_38_13]PIQ56827.1 MAG: hypothetical protein COW01_03065 [Bdellovibrionales bacterium CG12_big_fil_rev_8_21_14_0_65_38_15]PIR28529.1 MAG: hypothetical protein COV38_15235 [Bdellovibrionales bacterium CG11_big_fil_rev_8_21_14_0_20_38_13]